MVARWVNEAGVGHEAIGVRSGEAGAGEGEHHGCARSAVESPSGTLRKVIPTIPAGGSV